MDFREFFPHRFCINLDRRPERWRRARVEFARRGVGPVERFAALDGETLERPDAWTGRAGVYGCLRSHLEVVREARARCLPRVMIFEDDVVLDEEFAARFDAGVRDLPRDWDMLFFGGLHLYVRPAPVRGSVYRVTHTYSTYAYALNSTVYDAFIEANARALEAVDKVNVRLQKDFNCYCFMPHLAWVEEGFSDTENLPSDPWYLKESLVLLSPEAEELRRRAVVVVPHDGRAARASAVRDFKHAVNFYTTYHPEMSLVVVEQGERPRVDASALPEGCRYELLRDDGPFDNERCFRRAFELFGPEKELFLFTESDIFIDRGSIIVNLEMCLRHDYVSAFGRLLDLTEEDTRRVLAGEVIDVSPYSTRPRADIFRGPRFVTRRGLETLARAGALGRPNGANGFARSKLRGQLSVFESPNHAMILHRGRE